jgi:hypothetical protein
MGHCEQECVSLGLGLGRIGKWKENMGEMTGVWVRWRMGYWGHRCRCG